MLPSSWRFALLLSLGSVPSLAHAVPPAMTAAEESALRAREVVVRDLPARQPGAVRVEALIDIQASKPAVWDAVVDFPARLAGNKSLKSVDAYRAPTGDELWYRFTASSFGFELVYHNHYALDSEAGALTYELDRTQQNDLIASKGTFAIHPSPAGAAWCRLVYEAESDFGHALPSSVQRWMSSGATKDFLADIARRAEAAK